MEKRIYTRAAVLLNVDGSRLARCLCDDGTRTRGQGNELRMSLSALSERKQGCAQAIVLHCGVDTILYTRWRDAQDPLVLGCTGPLSAYATASVLEGKLTRRPPPLADPSHRPRLPRTSNKTRVKLPDKIRYFQTGLRF